MAGRGASAHSIREVRTQLKSLGATSFQLAKQEIAELARVLLPTEHLEAFMFGYYDAGYALLVATNARVLFIDKRFYNLKVEDIPYNTISSVEYHLGFAFGTAKIYTRAQNFNIWWVKKRDLMNFCDYVDGQMLSNQSRDAA